MSEPQGERAGGAGFTVLNPATEQPVATVAQASAADTDAAVARAAAAWPAWRAVAPGERAALLRSFADAIGRELGPDAPEAFTETKNVFIATED